jgi:hypothetical protein
VNILPPYKDAIDYFTEHPEDITLSYGSPEYAQFGYLFAYMTKDRKMGSLPPPPDEPGITAIIHGCPVMIKCSRHDDDSDDEFPNGRTRTVAAVAALTEAVASSKIPYDFLSLDNIEKLKYLPDFAWCQQVADKMLQRSAPINPVPNQGDDDEGADAAGEVPVSSQPDDAT